MLRGGGTHSFTLRSISCKNKDRCYNSDMTHHNIKRFGFTLSEVLITLGIIGVIAALTIPLIVTNYQKKQTAVQLKQAYSLMYQAINFAILDNGPIETWNWYSSSVSKLFSDIYLKPYLKVVKEYTTLPSDYVISCPNSSVSCLGYGGADKTTTAKYILENGVMIITGFTSSSGSRGLTIITDINGFKGPNRYGRDVFMFSMDTKSGFVPYGMGIIASNDPEDYVTPTREFLLNGEARSCSKDGIYCAGVIMIDGWTIKNDYPW